MEKPNTRGSQNFIVGLFASVALLVGFGFVVFMGRSFFGSDFRVRTVFEDVRGLNIGAPAFLSGIQVGRVSQMVFPGEDDDLADKKGIVVILTLETDHRHRVRDDSEVTITTQGMLGDKVIVLTPGQGKSVVESGWLKSRQPKELNEYFSKGGNLVETLLLSATNLNMLIESLNEGDKIGSTLSQMNQTFKEFALLGKKLNEGDGSLAKLIRGGEEDPLAPSLKSLERILAKVDAGSGSLGALVNDPSLHEDLRILLGGAQRSTAVRFLIRQAISSKDEAARGP